MSSISPKKVEFEGPLDADIMCVGEAPGEWEERLGRPFVSRSIAKSHGFTMDENKQTAGELLERYLGRLGISRDRVYLANLCEHRPPGNQFKALLGSKELNSGLEQLSETIDRVKPKVIVALGGWPTWYLAGKCGKNSKTKKPEPGSGITTYRGSRYPCHIGSDGREQKVICAYHPAGVLRNWKNNPIFYWDLERAVEDSKFPELRYPEYDSFIDPSKDVLYELCSEALSSPFISIDIETFKGGRYSCIGFSFRSTTGSVRDKGVCVTFKRPDLTRLVREVWESPTPKIFQYGTYDISFMRNFYGWRIGGYYDNLGWDTYIASASIFPDYPRKLEFLTSLHTRMPFYKMDRKEWKEKDDMNILWRYNIKDCISTYLIAMEQMQPISTMFNQRRAV